MQFDSGLLLVRSVGDLEVVGDLEDPGHTIGTNTRYILVCLAIDYPIQGDIAVHDRDADGLRRVEGISLQAGIAVNSPVNLLAGAIVHGRQRVDLDVVDHILHAGEMARE